MTDTWINMDQRRRDAMNLARVAQMMDQHLRETNEQLERRYRDLMTNHQALQADFRELREMYYVQRQRANDVDQEAVDLTLENHELQNLNYQAHLRIVELQVQVARLRAQLTAYDPEITDSEFEEDQQDV